MLRFEDPIFLWLLCILPVLILIRLIGWRRRHAKLKKLGDPELLKQLMPGISKYRPTVKFCLLLSALALLIVMLARPQMGSKISHDKRQGIETIICLDISNSMLAEDVVPSRLDKSKMLVENLVDNFTNDKIGLIVFAGDAFVQLPITSDYVSAKMFLQNITPDLIQTQGTNIADAIDLASKSFTQQNNVGRAIVVITDGENHEPGATEAAAAAKKKGINVFILGIGNTTGAPIPMGDGGYLKDHSGNTVMTALNENMCKELAQAGSGQYIHVDNTSDAEKTLNDDLAKLQKGDTSSVIYSEYDEQFQAVGILVILLLIIEICIMEVKNPLLRNVMFFGKAFSMGKAAKSSQLGKTSVLLLLLIVNSGLAFAQNDRTFIRQGNKLYRSQKWAQAETQYRKAISKNAKNTQALYNLGCALMMQQKDSMAMVQYQPAAQEETNVLRRSKSYHNMGVIMQNHREYAKAIECYKMALRCNPQDNETRYNLALCKKLLKNQPQKNNKDNKNNKNKNNEQDKNNKKNNDKDKNKQNQNEERNQDKMSKDNAEQLLNAAIQQEKATKQKMQKALSQPKSRSYEKNW
ncbi:VWA domain-containing protein [Segatella hominis]|uniref:VWA domain-containing protein n=1 Tax=Segatella hominis TaxID=2518605 RepID=UPI003AB96C4D